MSIFANNLKALRKRTFSTQEDVAKVIGLSRSAVSALENEKNDPSIDSLIKISDHFDIPVDDLIRSDIRIKDKRFST
jgi:DNA-binding XRE family transcriptional regulator